uniref:Uncharacterized protein n=1 Tax=Rhizophora mucronata TaxID=61149 RepID=A0A2P2NYQ3_RHIMU
MICRTLYMQAFGPPENDAKTIGHGIIFSSPRSSLRMPNADASAFSGKNKLRNWE